jgi:hypothetical protein
VDNIRIDIKEMWCEDWNRLEEGPLTGSCEVGSEPSVKDKEFIDKLTDYQLLRAVIIHGVRFTS